MEVSNVITSLQSTESVIHWRSCREL
jgi:hypothetical protein